jgi:hypothetical protein
MKLKSILSKFRSIDLNELTIACFLDAQECLEWFVKKFLCLQQKSGVEQAFSLAFRLSYVPVQLANCWIYYLDFADTPITA